MTDYYFPEANLNRLYPYAVSEALGREVLWEPSYAEFEDPEFFEKIERDAELKRLLTYRCQLVASERWFLEPASDSREDRQLANLLTSLIKKIPLFQARRFLLARAFYRASTWLRIKGSYKVVNLPVHGQGRWWTITSLKDVDKREFELQRNFEAERRDPERRRYWRWMLADKSTGHLTYKPVDLRNFVRHVYQDEERGLGHGTSIADALYFLNWFKQETMRSGMQFLGRWSQGLLVYYIDRMARGLKDTGTSDRRASDALALLRKIRSGNNVVMDKDEKVEHMNTPSGGWSTAREALQYLDEQASRLILGSVTNTGGGTDRGSLARAETEKDSMEALIQFDRGVMDETITEQVVRPLVENNWAMIVSLGLGKASKPAFRSTGDAHSDPKGTVEIFSTLAEKLPGALSRVPATEFYQRLGVSPAAMDEGVETMADILGAPKPAEEEKEPEKEEAAAAAPTSPVESTQVSTLVEIVQAVSAGQLPAESAREIIAVSFPSFPGDALERMLGAAVNFEPQDNSKGEADVPTP